MALFVGAMVLLGSAPGCLISDDDSETGSTPGDESNTSAGPQGSSGGWPGGPGGWPESGDDESSDDEPGGEDDSKAQDIPFTFSMPGAEQPVYARVVKPSSIVIDKFPESYGFDLGIVHLPQFYPRELDDEYCSMIEDYVDLAKGAQEASAEMAVEYLRGTNPSVTLKVPFGAFFQFDVHRVAREAALKAGASTWLRLVNGPQYKELRFEMSFTQDSLTRKMGDHEQAKKQFQAQFEKVSIGGMNGDYRGGTNWPDLLCDLLSNRAQIQITMNEEGWSTVAQSQGLVLP